MKILLLGAVVAAVLTGGTVLVTKSTDDGGGRKTAQAAARMRSGEDDGGTRTTTSGAARTGTKPTPTPTPPAPTTPAVGATGSYVVIAWNDLGMHCISPRFQEMAILPPYNNLWAVVIRRGEEPQLLTRGVSVAYSIDNNTTVADKTDFWTYAPQLFGKALPLGVGLTGNGLAGKMTAVTDHFEATGIPVLPYNDGTPPVWNPYQRATLKVTDATGKQLGTTSVVVPVSDELNCQKCHATGGVAAKGIATPSIEGNILTLHDKREGTNLMAARPVLCGSCHADAALGTAGKTGVESMSLAMHKKHSSVAAQPACFDCHPGAKTKCNRSAIANMGPVGADPRCETCHGDLGTMTQKLVLGRKPWAEEPTCAQCHGKSYATGTLLYRNSRGHGGVPCAACHNSPHAWYPSTRADDNNQVVRLQGSTKALGYKACVVCHTDGRKGTVPPHNGEGGGYDD